MMMTFQHHLLLTPHLYTPDGECASSACSTSKTADAPGKSKRLHNLPSFIRKSMRLLLTDYLSENTFGAMKKGECMPASDFLVTEVICDVPSSSGYLFNLTPAHSNVTRCCSRCGKGKGETLVMLFPTKY